MISQNSPHLNEQKISQLVTFINNIIMETSPGWRDRLKAHPDYAGLANVLRQERNLFDIMESLEAQASRDKVEQRLWYHVPYNGGTWIAYRGDKAIWEAHEVSDLRKGVENLGYDWRKFERVQTTLLVIR